MEKTIQNDGLSRLVLSSPRTKDEAPRSVSGKLIDLRGNRFLSLVFKYKTKETTENVEANSATDRIAELIDGSFYQAELSTSEVRWHLILNTGKNGKLKRAELSEAGEVSKSHDKQKKRLISGAPFLAEVGICSADGSVKPSMSDKFKQINRYVEIVDGILRNADLGDTFSIADMGCGKGYLTFALYHHLTENLKLNTSIIGVEVRENLIDKCNGIANKLGYERLIFEVGAIVDTKIEKADVLIALHACDTATDDAIFRGIQDDAKVILTAPCCHKQVRKSLQTEGELSLITQHGILKERQAEILTDTIRSLILEANGYKTKVFEFISTEHTPKNVMIAAIKVDTLNREAFGQIQDLKSSFGLDEHYLETLFEA